MQFSLYRGRLFKFLITAYYAVFGHKGEADIIFLISVKDHSQNNLLQLPVWLLWLLGIRVMNKDPVVLAVAQIQNNSL